MDGKVKGKRPEEITFNDEKASVEANSVKVEEMRNKLLPEFKIVLLLLPLLLVVVLVLVAVIVAVAGDASFFFFLWLLSLSLLLLLLLSLLERLLRFGSIAAAVVSAIAAVGNVILNYTVLAGLMNSCCCCKCLLLILAVINKTKATHVACRWRMEY